MSKTNKICISLTIIVVFGLITGVTTYKVYDKHNKKVLLVESKYIVEQAKKCINEKKCNAEKITLQELYEKNYLEKQVNKVTKEYYNPDSYVIKNNNDYEFIAL